MGRTRVGGGGGELPRGGDRRGRFPRGSWPNFCLRKKKGPFAGGHEITRGIGGHPKKRGKIKKKVRGARERKGRGLQVGPISICRMFSGQKRTGFFVFGGHSPLRICRDWYSLFFSGYAIRHRHQAFGGGARPTGRFPGTDTQAIGHRQNCSGGPGREVLGRGKARGCHTFRAKLGGHSTVGVEKQNPRGAQRNIGPQGGGMVISAWQKQRPGENFRRGAVAKTMQKRATRRGHSPPGPGNID